MNTHTIHTHHGEHTRTHILRTYARTRAHTRLAIRIKHSHVTSHGNANNARIITTTPTTVRAICSHQHLAWLHGLAHVGQHVPHSRAHTLAHAQRPYAHMLAAAFRLTLS
jgi:hypothetical protein